MSDEKQELKELILAKAKEGKVVFATFEGLMAADLNEFIKQPADGILYDLNRLPEVVLTFLDDPKWVNDFAVSLVIRKLKEELDGKLTMREPDGGKAAPKSDDPE
jgi:hypothetical protein